VLKLLSRNRSRPRSDTVYSLFADPVPDECSTVLDDPQAQLDLVARTLNDLSQLRQLVQSLPEVPLGSRDDLLAQLTDTTDSLRALYFLDAIY
jgi:hypothetical protein